MILFTALDPRSHRLIIGRGTDERSAADDLVARIADYVAKYPNAHASEAWRINFESPLTADWS